MSRKLLILESDWRHTPSGAPTESRSTARLYRSVCHDGLHCLHQALNTDWPDAARDFARLPDNRRGVNVVIVSTHASPQGLATFGGIAPLAGLAGSDGLRRTLLLLDTCHLGGQVEALLAASGALGVIGFAGEVDWTASSVFVLALLRHWQRHGVFDLRRCSAVRPRKILQRLEQGDYAALMARLDVRYRFIRYTPSA